MKLNLLILLLITAFFARASTGFDTTGHKDFLYRGTEYTKIFTKESGSPFLDVGGAAMGWVNYYGAQYQGVQLQYDIEDDQLVSIDLTGAVRMQMVKQKITSFGIGDRTFIRLPGPDLFLERVYHGKRDVLIRWQKVLVRTGTDEGKYKLYKSYFIADRELPVSIASNRDLFNYFGKHSKELREYFRDQKLSLRKDPVHALVSVVSFADKNNWHGE